MQSTTLSAEVFIRILDFNDKADHLGFLLPKTSILDKIYSAKPSDCYLH